MLCALNLGFPEQVDIHQSKIRRFVHASESSKVLPRFLLAIDRAKVRIMMLRLYDC